MPKPRLRRPRTAVEAAASLGYAVSRTRSGHIRFVHSANGNVVVGSSTPGEYRSEKNTISALYRCARSSPTQQRPFR